MFHWLAMTRSHFYGELIDIDDDAQVGKNTTAVKIGKRRAVQLMLALSLSSAVVSSRLVGQKETNSCANNMTFIVVRSLISIMIVTGCGCG